MAQWLGKHPGTMNKLLLLVGEVIGRKGRWKRTDLLIMKISEFEKKKLIL